MRKFVVSHLWWMVLLTGVMMLVAHTLSFEPVRIDNTSIILLLVVFLSPFIPAIKRIKFGEFEAEIDPKEVQRIKAEVMVHASKGNGASQTTQAEAAVKSINNLVESDPILALAKLRIELEKTLTRLYRITHKDAVKSHYMSVGRLVQVLATAEIIPRDVALSTREVMSVCTRAIHGEDIRQRDAESVVEAGSTLLIQLLFYMTEFSLKPAESGVVDENTVEELRNAEYRVTTIVPLLENPEKNVYILDQDGLDDFLEGYNEYAEFIVDVRRGEKGQTRGPSTGPKNKEGR